MSELLQQLIPAKLAQYFDHTQLAAAATRSDFVTLCDESRQYGFKTVAVNPAAITLCRELLSGTGVLVDAAIGFPLGQTTKENKLAETIDAIQKGADEIDYVVNIGMLKDKHYDFIEQEMDAIVRECRKQGRTSKVIFENCYLTDDEKRALCKIALSVRPDFIKTSTGFGTGGATLDDLRLMKDMVGDSIKIKAAGGVRTLDTALAMIELGVERIGSKSSVSILKEFIEKF